MARTKVRAAAAEPIEGPWVLPDGWHWERLSDAADICDYLRRPINNTERLARKEGKASSALYPYYGATGQAGVIDDYLADGDFILLGEDGAPFLEPFKAKAYSVSGRFWVNNHAHVLKGRAHLDQRILLHWLNTMNYEPFVNGTTRLKLTQGAMVDMPVPIPPADYQPSLISRIDALFAEVEDGEAALARARADLGVWRKSLLKAAVTGELTADWRAERLKEEGPPPETGSDLLARILTERRTRWHAEPRNKGKRYVEPLKPEAALSELPMGWSWASVDQLAGEQLIGLDRGRPMQSVLPTDGVPYVKMNNVTVDGRVEWANLRYVAASPAEVARFSLKAGDILFNTRNSLELVGKAGCVLNPPTNAIFNNNLLRLRLGSAVDPLFIAMQMIAMPFRLELERIKRATTSVAAIYVNTLVPLALAVPPLAEQQEILSRIGKAIHVGYEDDIAIETSTLRQSILAAAFRGALTA